MSEEKIRELYRQLSDKRIALAKAYAEKAEPSILVKFDMEIITIRREIFLELQTLEESYQKEEWNCAHVSAYEFLHNLDE